MLTQSQTHTNTRITGSDPYVDLDSSPQLCCKLYSRAMLSIWPEQTKLKMLSTTELKLQYTT
jgi:hypothetical protein